jgi:hypothetical protein
MSAKQLLFHDNVRGRIRRGVETLAEAVKVTLVLLGHVQNAERDLRHPSKWQHRARDYLALALRHMRAAGLSPAADPSAALQRAPA